MDDPKYYLLYRIDNGEWKSIFYRSFLTNTSNDKIYGQFISSSWFNINIDHVSLVEMLVVRFNASTHIGHDSICENLRTDETLPEFVVAHDLFIIDELKRSLSDKMIRGKSSKLIHQEQSKQIGVSIQAVHIGEGIIEYTLSRPMFVISKQ